MLVGGRLCGVVACVGGVWAAVVEVGDGGCMRGGGVGRGDDVVQLFVQEDFEWICYNALRCNQKRSILWAAAGELLRRGKKRLEEYEGCGEKLVALDQSEAREGGSGRAKSEDVEGRIQVGEKCLAGEGVKMAISSASTGSAESEVPSCGGASMCKNAGVGKDSGSMRRGTAGTQMTEGEPSVDGKGAGAVSGGTWAHRDGATASTEVRSAGSGGRGREGVGRADKDVDVEGEEGDVDSGEYRLDADGEATESSSSYGSAGSWWGGEGEGEGGAERVQSAFEAESDLRDGNGAVGLAEEEEGVAASER